MVGLGVLVEVFGLLAAAEIEVCWSFYLYMLRCTLFFSPCRNSEDTDGALAIDCELGGSVVTLLGLVV